MKLNPADIKLNALILTESLNPLQEAPQPEAFDRLYTSLQIAQLVESVALVSFPYFFPELENLRYYYPLDPSSGENIINTIFLNPLPSPTIGKVDFDEERLSRLEEITKFIFTVRQKYPGVVFVLYLDSAKLASQEQIFYAGERSRFKHYFQLDSNLVGQEFDAKLDMILKGCRGELVAYKKKTLYKYDVALSFAGEDRPKASKLAEVLQLRGLKVFYDENMKADIWGKNLVDYLTEIYLQEARYCVMFLSKYYAEKFYPKHERQAAQASNLISENEEYILPIRLDDTKIPGILPTVAYLSWPPETAESIADLIEKKLGQTSF